VEDVAAMHHQVHLAGQRRRQRGGVIGKKVVTATAALDAWLDGQVEAEVRVGQQQDPDLCHAGG
jgi:hypothetical protein